jgi:superfamily II DNA or RNA helicase
VWEVNKYQEFLDSKRIILTPSGFEPVEPINSIFFDYERDITAWAIRKGRAALFENCGLGKTFQQLEWAKHICNYTGGSTLILAPLSVASQTVFEGQKIDIPVNLCRKQSEVKSGINITNYEILSHFNPDKFDAVVADESSILKSMNGSTRNELIDMFRNTPFKLACTATPAPNDHLELGNHAEFLGVMSMTEMLSTFFVHDGGDTSKWRLKGHAVRRYWEWVASWAVMLQKPSDLGYSDEGFELPELRIHQVTIQIDRAPEGQLFATEAITLQERQQARRDTVKERAEEAAKIVNKHDEPFVIWCNLNSEADELSRTISESVEIRGSHAPEFKEASATKFSAGEIKKIITKPSIFGFGLNWQHCSKMVFTGLSDSFEEWYQAIRRCWRFGQKNPVDVWVVTAETEGAVVANIKRKEADFNVMLSGMVSATQEITKRNIVGTVRQQENYSANKQMIVPGWLKEEAC